MLFAPCKVEMPVTDEAADLEGDEEAMEFSERFGCIDTVLASVRLGRHKTQPRGV